jgi:hypothetical protein
MLVYFMNTQEKTVWHWLRALFGPVHHVHFSVQYSRLYVDYCAGALITEI